MAIPIRNLYYLLAYAWDGRKSSGVRPVGPLDAETPMDLLAELVTIEAERLLRRGLDRGYRDRSGELAAPRGKMDLTITTKRALLARRRVHCHISELRRNVPHNQAIKACLETLSRFPAIARDLRRRARRAAERFAEVDSIRLSPALLRRVQLHRNNSHYRFPIRLTELICRQRLVQPEAGGSLFPDYTESPQEMGRIFERFVRNFLRREQTEFRVGAAKIPWAASWGSERAGSLLPEMQSDVFLKTSGRRVVVECKFYEKRLARHFGKRKVRSAHLYQLMAYLRGLDVTLPGRAVEGMLLYAGTGTPLDLDYVIEGLPVRVRSLELNQPWTGIRADLLSLASLPRPLEAQRSAL